MKKYVILAISALFVAANVVMAQTADTETLPQPEIVYGQQDTVQANDDARFRKLFISAQGGISLSVNENGAAFFNTNNGGKLVKGEGGLSVGYYIVPRFGVRATVEYSENASAANYNENFDSKGNKKFLPYDFSSVSAFADFVLNGGNVDKPRPFNWRLFAGVGYAYSFNFKSACETDIDDFTVENGKKKKYEITRNNGCFAFRFGFILEYVFKCGVGLFFEGNHEWMTDNFNGMVPLDGKGHNNSFPFDTRFNNQLGVSYHF